MKTTFEFKRCMEVLHRDGTEQAILFAQRNVQLFRLAARVRERTHGKHDPIRARYMQTAVIYRQILLYKLLTASDDLTVVPAPRHRAIFGLQA